MGERGKTQIQDRMLFVYNVKNVLEKKKRRKTTYEKSLGFGFWSGVCFEKAKEAPLILNPHGYRALSSEDTTQ